MNPTHCFVRRRSQLQLVVSGEGVEIILDVGASGGACAERARVCELELSATIDPCDSYLIGAQVIELVLQ